MSRLDSEYLLEVTTPRVLLPDLNKETPVKGKLKREATGNPVFSA